MKYLASLFLLLFCTHCHSQEEELILSQRLITDLSPYPIYPRLVEQVEGETQWKAEYQYLDSIEIYGIVYWSDGLKIRGLLIKPRQSGQYPCIIYNRGGNRQFGKLVVADAALKLGRLAKEGYVVIASQYRGNGGSEGKEEFGGRDVNDVAILPRVLSEVEGADTSRIGMYGWSRGGMMTFLALTRSEEIKVAATVGARSDLTVIDRPEMEAGAYSQLIPGYPENKKEELQKRSAIFWVDQFPRNVPILLLHGSSDWRVKATNSLRLALEFEKHRIPYRLKIYEGADHSISEFKEEMEQDILHWFDKYLKNREPLPDTEFHGP